MMDVVQHYDPDFIYTDGTVQGPFTGEGTGTGYKANAMQTVIADFYNRTLARRGKVNTFSIVKFRNKTNGTVTTEGFGIPPDIKTDQPWIAEAPVGDWFYAPGFTYDSFQIKQKNCGGIKKMVALQAEIKTSTRVSCIRNPCPSYLARRAFGIL
ncbi:hypothetical protein ACRQ5D_32490 [Mucilaginibacter sp. P25]|uniref:hypothetical protein n=1 Tax=Mucilaginibacter sp. P25 TaxID=3423945 RepID=UPI003D7AB5E3